jgi:FkbM family methyltransferase
LVERDLAKRAARRLAIIRHAEEVSGSVAMTCRYYGISRACFYIWLERYREFGADGLRDRSKRPHSSPNATKEEVIGKIIYLRQNYHFRPERVAMHLKRYHDIHISPCGVWRILRGSPSVNGLCQLNTSRSASLRRLQARTLGLADYPGSRHGAVEDGRYPPRDASVIVTTTGLRVGLRDRGTDGWLGDRAAFFQVFFAREYNFLLSRISPGDIVLDAGANIGCFSLQASRRVGPRGVVVSVEPEPSNADRLRANIRLNRISNVIVVERALDAIPDVTVHMVGTGVMARVGQAGNAVRTITLDHVLEELSIEKLDAIKMDIEGAEKAIFAKSATSAVLGSARVVAVEVHDREGAQLVQSRLRADGYSWVGQVKPESHFMISSMLGTARRPDLVLRLYRAEVITVAARILAGGLRTRPRSDSDAVGLVYASR